MCLESLTWTVYPVPIPCHLGHSYAVDVYTSWVLFHVKSGNWDSPRISCAIVRSLREGGYFTDSKSFIMALRSRRPDDLGIGLVDMLLAACVRMS